MGRVPMSFCSSITCTDHYSSRYQPHECGTIYYSFIARYDHLNFALILLGRVLSDSFSALMNGIHTYSRIMYVIIIIAIIYFVIRYFMKRRKTLNKTQAEYAITILIGSLSFLV